MKTISIIIVLIVSIIFAQDSSNCSNANIKGSVKISGPNMLYGQRSKANILRLVMMNLRGLRLAYNERLHAGFRFEGKVLVKFALNAKGNILFSKLDSTDISDTIFVKNIVDIIKTWKHDEFSNLKDTSIVLYPFIFSLPPNCKDVIEDSSTK